MPTISTEELLGTQKKTISTEELFAQPKGKSLRKGIFGSVPEEDYQRGERNIAGAIFERPGAAIRSALTGKGYVEGAVNPTEVPTFQESALKKYYGEGKPSALKTIGGFGVSAAGMAGDILTNPADVIGLMTGAKPVRDITGLSKVGAAIGATKVGKSLKAVATTPITKENIIKPFAKASELLKVPVRKTARGVERVGGAIAGIEPKILNETRQQGFRNVLQKRYYDTKVPEKIVESIDNNIERLKEVAGNKFNEQTAILRTQPFDYNLILEKVQPLSLDIKRNPFKSITRQLDQSIFDGLTDPNLEVNTLGDMLDLRRSLDEVIFTAKGQKIQSKFAMNVRKSINEVLHKNTELAKADEEWTSLQNMLSENKRVFGETGEAYLKRWENLSAKQKEKLSLLESELIKSNPEATPFINDLTNYSLAKYYETPTFSSVYPFSMVRAPIRAGYRGYLRTFGRLSEEPKKPISLKARNP